MKNILYLFLAVTIFACSSDDSNDNPVPAQLGVPFSLPPYLLPVVFDYFLLKKLRKLSFLLGLMGVYLLFFHKYLSPYLSPKKIKTCKSSRYTGHCGAKRSEVELFWRGFD